VIILHMGAAIWTFLRTRPGELLPVSYRAVDEFLSGGGRLQADAEGFVRYAEVIVNLENRRAREVLRAGFFQHRARKDGQLDRKHFKEVLAATADATMGWLQLDESPPGVIPAEHQFAKRRLEHLSTWKATPDELAALRELVNRKAGREIM
jgi:hypothetical protein